MDGPYEYQPIENEYGSSTNYHIRKRILQSTLQSLPYEEVMSEYGPCMILVASLEERWRALASHLSITHLQQLSPVHYCILELIGKSRENVSQFSNYYFGVGTIEAVSSKSLYGECRLRSTCIHTTVYGGLTASNFHNNNST